MPHVIDDIASEPEIPSVDRVSGELCATLTHKQAAS